MLKIFINTFKWTKLSLHPNLGQLVVLFPCLVCLSHLVSLSCSSYFPSSFLLLVIVFICLKWLVFHGSGFSFIFSCVLELGMAKLRRSKTCAQEFTFKRLCSWACIREFMLRSLHLNSSVQIFHWCLRVNLGPNLGHLVILLPCLGHLTLLHHFLFTRR